MQANRFFLLLLLFFGHSSFAQTWADTAAVLDKLLARYQSQNPGVQLAIGRHGQVLYSAAKGMADLEHQVPLTITSRIEAGSVSKQFTAAAILLLQQQGKLSLADDVRNYLPELPNYGHTITIRHLMTHVSGLKDWGSIAYLTGWPRGEKAYTNDDALQIILRQKSLNNKPGDEYIYSNSGYTLMVHIVQRVSGQTHADFTRQHIFEPAGMRHTQWRNDFRKVVPERAIAYRKAGDEYLMEMPFEDTYGHGGLLTTAEDLLRWNNFYLNGKLGTAPLLPAQTAVLPLNNGRRNNYAAGLVIDSVGGLLRISHSGATAGYRANLEAHPQTGLSIAVLSNLADGLAGGLTAALSAVFLKPSPSLAATPPAATSLALSAFAPYEGAYRESKTGAGLRVYRSDTALLSHPNGRLLPVAANAAMVGRARLEFKANPRQLVMITAGGDTLFYTGVDTAVLSGSVLTSYAGRYSSEETASDLDVLVKEGKLFFKLRQTETPLTAVYKDGFSFPGGDLYFERRKTGKITQLTISIPRARRVVFKKSD